MGLLVLAYQLVLEDQVGLLVPDLHFLPWLLLRLVLLVTLQYLVVLAILLALQPPTD